MKAVLFDLGRTLEHQDHLLPGAVATLAAVQGLSDAEGLPVPMGLISDFDMPQSPADILLIRQSYYAILDSLGIRSFFEPVDTRVTLSTDVGVFKPDERIFRRALDKLSPGLPFGSAIFITEDATHVAAARALGMRAVHFKGPGQSRGDILQLLDVVPIVRDFVAPGPVATAISVGRTSAASAIAPVPGMSWARFGDEIFLFGKGAGWDDVAARVQGGTVRQASGELRRDQLHVVIQKGRLFQNQYPDIPILLDRGRYLVVALDPARATWIGRHHEPCYTIRPLDDRYIAFETRARSADRTAEVSWVRSLVNTVSRQAFESDLAHLVSYSTRLSTSNGYRDAATWASHALGTMGYQTTSQTIDVAGGTSQNIIADRPGAGPEPRSVVIVTAHLDSVNHNGGASAPSPGADDNGSGSAGVLEIARTFRNHTNTNDLRFILFGGEEQGLIGSLHYVDQLTTFERDRIRAVINMDMIGCRNRSPSSVLIEGAAVSQAVMDGLAESAATYTDLVVETSLNPFASDHVPFIQRSLPAILTIEGADQANTNIHSGDDTIGHINYDIALEILRMNVGFIALAVGQTTATPSVRLAGPDRTWTGAVIFAR